jgi:hypothetical protein
MFKVYGPFEIENKQKVYDREFQKIFWSECVDDEADNFQLSLAKGIYLFSLRNAANYTPQYVGRHVEILELKFSTIEIC